MEKKQNKAYLCALVIGIILIIIGLVIQIPGGVLTTYGSFDGSFTDYYVFDNRYSSIDEYVGGDAYNFIIGASLVAGKMAGCMAAKSIFIVGGAICLCFGLTLMMQQKNTLNPRLIVADLKKSTANEAAKPETLVAEGSIPTKEEAVESIVESE